MIRPTKCAASKRPPHKSTGQARCESDGLGGDEALCELTNDYGVTMVISWRLR